MVMLFLTQSPSHHSPCSQGDPTSPTKALHDLGPAHASQMLAWDSHLHFCCMRQPGPSWCGCFFLTLPLCSCPPSLSPLDSFLHLRPPPTRCSVSPGPDQLPCRSLASVLSTSTWPPHTDPPQSGSSLQARLALPISVSPVPHSGWGPKWGGFIHSKA